MDVNVVKAMFLKRIGPSGEEKLDMILQNDEMEHAVDATLHCTEHIQLLLSYLRGDVDYMGRLIFDDLSRHISADDHGITIERLEPFLHSPKGDRPTGHYYTHKFVIPGFALAAFIEAIPPAESESAGSSAVMSFDTLCQIKADFAPRIRFNITPGARAILSEGFKTGDENERDTLIRALRSLQHLARRHSDGQITTVFLREDYHDVFYHVKDYTGTSITLGGIVHHVYPTTKALPSRWQLHE